MSVERAGRVADADDIAAALSRWRSALFRAAFGDRVGAVVFLAALAFAALHWRVGVFINDNYTVANALVAVADGHLHVTEIVYGPDSGNTPGMRVSDGRIYGRNYALVFASLPVLWLLDGVAAVADPRIALAGAWSLAVLALCLQVGSLVERRDEAAFAGSALALVLFAANVAVATPLDPRWHALVALQVTTMLATALVGVVLYRLLAAMHGRRVGAFAGVAVVLATPLAFWASLPKRHALTALLAVTTVYCFYLSRRATDDRTALRYRALSYGWIGLCAWVHAPEALVLLSALVPVDLLTARSNRPRDLAVVGAAFALSLVPFLATNLVVSGHPLEPPALLSTYHGGELGPTGSGESAGGGSSGGSGGGQTTSTPDGGSNSGQTTSTSSGDTSGGQSTSTPDGGSSGGQTGDASGGDTSGGGVDLGSLPGVSLVLSALSKAEILTSLFVDGLTAVWREPTKLVRTFVRSGYIADVAVLDGDEAVNLTVLESMPLAGALLAAPAVLADRARAGRLREYVRTPAAATDALAAALALAVTVVYMQRLPLHAQVTVRYLLPVMVLGAYGVARLPVVRRTVRERTALLAWSYAGLVLVGGQLALVALVILNLTLGGAVQLHGLAGLAIGAALGGWATTATVVDVDDRLGAGLLALAAAATTAFVLLAGWEYFVHTRNFGLPVGRALADAIAVL